MAINSLKKILKKSGIFLIIMALVCTGAFLFIIINNKSDLPEWIEWKNGIYFDSGNQYEISLSGKSVNIIYDNAVTWTSPDSIKVQQVLSCDIDNDYEDELILLCWKKGRFGDHKPFWADDDEAEEDKWSQHIFIYEYGKYLADKVNSGEMSSGDVISAAVPGEIRPKWMSSYIGQDVAEIASNGRKAPYCRLLLTAPDGQVSSWIWDSWGLSKE